MQLGYSAVRERFYICDWHLVFSIYGHRKYNNFFTFSYSQSSLLLFIFIFADCHITSWDLFSI